MLHKNKKQDILTRSKKFLPLLVLSIIVIYLYSPLTAGFFQQDEWYSFGLYILHRNLGHADSLKYFFAPSVGHYNPLTNTLQHNLFSFWGMNYTNFVLLGIALHLAVTLILFFLGRVVFKGNNLLSFLTALLFGVFAAIYQGTAWVVADISTLIASLFGLVSFLLFFKFLENKKSNYLLWSLVVLIISLLFKEVTIGLFLIYFVYCLIKPKDNLKFKYVYLVIIFGLVYLFFRASMIFMPNTTGDRLVVQSQSVRNIVYNFLTIPLKSITQTILPLDFIKIVSFKIAGFFPVDIAGPYGSPEFEVFAVKRVMEVINIVFGVSIIALTMLIVKRAKRVPYKAVILLGLGWAIVNSFIFSFSPEAAGIIFAIDSRNLYFTSIGISIFVISLIYLIVKEDYRKTVYLFIPIFIFNVMILNNNLQNFTNSGFFRKNILLQITEEHPQLGQKTIFYIESDRPFYGLTENIIPFQSGFGQTLLSWYESRQNYPVDFFSNNFLWDIKSQGYMEVDSKGFGYFRDFRVLAGFVANNSFPTNLIISYSFNSNDNQLTDISNEVRERINGFLTDKQQINSNSLIVSASNNSKDAYLAIDSDRETLWSSNIPYINSQYFDIDMGFQRNITKIVVDSYKDKNQDKVGYEILLSSDNKNWIKVFHAKSYSPDINGLVNIYFKPQLARYIRIKQIGNHKYASWVINEIHLFEGI